MPEREQPDLDQVRDALRSHDERLREEHGGEPPERDEAPADEPPEEHEPGAEAPADEPPEQHEPGENGA
jgi:hypothetical protein